jgi:hypothetical protein
MDETLKHYLKKAHQVIYSDGDVPLKQFLAYYEQRPDDASIETDENGLTYCLFAINAEPIEDIHVFVFEQEKIVADYNGVHLKVDSLFNDKEAMKRLMEVGDWMMLEGILLGKVIHPELEIPLEEPLDYQEGEALLVHTAYVSKRLRRKGIYKTMADAARDLATRHVYVDMLFYSVISLDPDVASIGEDATDEPYYYNKEKDDPIRAVNKTIAEHTGMNVIHLDIDNLYEPDSQDGTKEWYAVKADQIVIGKPVLS